MFDIILRPQITQTAYLLSQGGLYRPIVEPARQATFLLQVFRLPSNGHLLHIIPIQGIRFTTLFTKLKRIKLSKRKHTS